MNRRISRLLRTLGALVVFFIVGAATSARADVIAEVRAATTSGAFDSAQKILATAQAQGGITPEFLEAMSWVARGRLAKHDYDAALEAAQKTYELAAQRAREQPLDSERHLPIALGAAIEVQAQAIAARGDRVKAVALLQGEITRYAKTSIVTRLQKNLNLLTLEGKLAPPLVIDRYLGPKPTSLEALRGKPVLLFFWAHWCGDCKATAPVIALLLREFAASGLQVLLPTQPYGFTDAAQDVPMATELPYIDAVRQRSYAVLHDVAAPVSTANFLTYGASSVPTIVLINRAGKVVLYHPGRMTYDELKPKVAAIVN